jgi:hypothetical protein
MTPEPLHPEVRKYLSERGTVGGKACADKYRGTQFARDRARKAVTTRWAEQKRKQNS